MHQPAGKLGNNTTAHRPPDPRTAQGGARCADRLGLETVAALSANLVVCCCQVPYRPGLAVLPHLAPGLFPPDSRLEHPAKLALSGHHLWHCDRAEHWRRLGDRFSGRQRLDRSWLRCPRAWRPRASNSKPLRTSIRPTGATSRSLRIFFHMESPWPGDAPPMLRYSRSCCLVGLIGSKSNSNRRLNEDLVTIAGMIRLERRRSTFWGLIRRGRGTRRTTMGR
jgi:hypothetical protein